MTETAQDPQVEHDQADDPLDHSPEARPPGIRSAVVETLRGLIGPVLAIITAVVVGGLIMVFSDPDTLDAWGSFFSDPGEALSSSWDLIWSSYRALFDTSLGSQRAIARTLVQATPLILVGLSVALAFRAGLFNIGGAGQLILGAMAAAWVGITFDLPLVVHLPLALVAGAIGGAFWGAIVGFLKARTGAHEVITSIMLNFVALRLLDYALSTDTFRREGRTDPISPEMPDSVRLPVPVDSFPVHVGFLLALAVAYGCWWLLQRSTIGFRMRAVGANPHAARYAGMGVAGTVVLSMAVAGGLAGLGGSSILLGSTPRLTGGFFASVGFDAIALALLGRATPIGVVGAGLLFGALQAGSTGMQAQTSTPIDIIFVIQALIILFVAAPAIIRAIWRVKETRLGAGQRFSAGWGAQ
ncbi:MAG: ABC transporter permease [Acidimicrobiia bacterium]